MNDLLHRLGAPLLSARDHKLILNTVSYLPGINLDRLAKTTKQVDATAISVVTNMGAVRTTYYFDPATGRLAEIQIITNETTRGPVETGTMWFDEPVIVPEIGVAP
ncbi:MAG TPA: hypothetical protein VM677_03390 [Actinokineospora sp.]|nr:hypothetical protein [Actinokineospora sp.]